MLTIPFSNENQFYLLQYSNLYHLLYTMFEQLRDMYVHLYYIVTCLHSVPLEIYIKYLVRIYSVCCTVTIRFLDYMLNMRVTRGILLKKFILWIFFLLKLCIVYKKRKSFTGYTKNINFFVLRVFFFHLFIFLFRFKQLHFASCYNSQLNKPFRQNSDLQSNGFLFIERQLTNQIETIDLTRSHHYQISQLGQF